MSTNKIPVELARTIVANGQLAWSDEVTTKQFAEQGIHLTFKDGTKKFLNNLYLYEGKGYNIYTTLPHPRKGVRVIPAMCWEMNKEMVQNILQMLNEVAENIELEDTLNYFAANN